ncbi:MAG: hypothetical protein NZ455_16345 [Bacteroidia bacterium]|nr:hypothetical protein [Bacteroidia bacterium]MDW8348591.1 hypothetical protein [Bacteroidia bacterium]
MSRQCRALAQHRNVSVAHSTRNLPMQAQRMPTRARPKNNKINTYLC